jgi:hypothetical protein
MLSCLRVLIAVVTLNALCSCLTNYPVIQVNPSGNLQRGVVFYFSDLFRGTASPFEITSINVGEFYPQADGGGVEYPRWNVSGRQTLKYAVYGRKYIGLKQEHGPTRPLQPGHKYVVYVLTATGSHNLFAFTVDQNGDVHRAPRVY